MPGVLFDASIYIAALRRGSSDLLDTRRLAGGLPVWVSAVVLEELYLGAAGRQRILVERLERDVERLNRILVPNLTDWTRTGKVLARLAARYGYEQIGRGRLTNDALIAVSAGRKGIRVLTINERDFRRLAEFHPFHWEPIAL